MQRERIIDYCARRQMPLRKAYALIERGDLKSEFVAGERYVVITETEKMKRDHADYKKALDATGLKRNRIAELIGISNSSLTGYMNGSHDMPGWVKKRMDDIIEKALSL